MNVVRPSVEVTLMLRLRAWTLVVRVRLTKIRAVPLQSAPEAEHDIGSSAVPLLTAIEALRSRSVPGRRTVPTVVDSGGLGERVVNVSSVPADWSTPSSAMSR